MQPFVQICTNTASQNGHSLLNNWEVLAKNHCFNLHRASQPSPYCGGSTSMRVPFQKAPVALSDIPPLQPSYPAASERPRCIVRSTVVGMVNILGISGKVSRHEGTAPDPHEGTSDTPMAQASKWRECSLRGLPTRFLDGFDPYPFKHLSLWWFMMLDDDFGFCKPHFALNKLSWEKKRM